MSEPGIVDMTADVDFFACAKSARRKGAKVYEAVTQSEFLFDMGISERMQQVLQSPNLSEGQAENLFENFKMLLDPKQMGNRFKVLCISNSNIDSIFGFSSSKNIF